MTPRSKHIAVKYHFFKDYIYQSNGAVKVDKVAMGDQVAYCMMKGLDKVLFHCAQAGECYLLCFLLIVSIFCAMKS